MLVLEQLVVEEQDNITEITFVPNAGIGVSITTFLNSLRVEEDYRVTTIRCH